MRRLIAVAAIATLFSGSAAAAVRTLGSSARPARATQPAAVSSSSSAMRTWTSAEGDLSLRYPTSWRVAFAGRSDGRPFESATLHSFSEAHARELMGGSLEGLVGDLYKIDIAIDDADGATMRSLAARCSEEPADSAERLDCRTVSVNGRTWLREELRDSVYTPVHVIALTTIANGRAYSLVAFVPEGDRASDGLAEIREIFSSAVVR